MSSICIWIQWKGSSRNYSFFKNASITACGKKFLKVRLCIYMYGKIKKIPHTWHMTYMASTIHIPYIFVHIPYIHTHTVWTWACMFVCRHPWQRCLKRGQREVFVWSRPSGMASLGTRITVTQWPRGTENFFSVGLTVMEHSSRHFQPFHTLQ